MPKIEDCEAEREVDLIVQNPAMVNKYRNSGFEIYWAEIARKLFLFVS
jgi:hypothetical protein